MFSRFSLSPSGILNWDSTQRKEDCFPSLPFSIRPWVGYPLYSSYEGQEGRKHSCGFSLFSQKEHLNRTESGLISYVFGVIMLESKSRYEAKLQTKTLSISKAGFFFPFKFSPFHSPPTKETSVALLFRLWPENEQTHHSWDSLTCSCGAILKSTREKRNNYRNANYVKTVGSSKHRSAILIIPVNRN